MTLICTQNVIQTAIKDCSERNLVESRSYLDRDLKRILQAEDVIKFTGSACDLSWKMVIQDPVMTLRTDGNHQAHNPDLQDILFTPPGPGQQQSGSHGQVIVQYIEPALYHGDTVLVKGRVKEVNVKQLKYQ